jgi:hypothetical protein
MNISTGLKNMAIGISGFIILSLQATSLQMSAAPDIQTVMTGT